MRVNVYAGRLKTGALFRSILTVVGNLVGNLVGAFCAVWRTLMRFPADIVQSITDAGKRNVLPTTVSP